MLEWLKPYMDDGELTTTDLPPAVMMDLKSEFTIYGVGCGVWRTVCGWDQVLAAADVLPLLRIC